MPLYFMHIANDRSLTVDETGRECVDHHRAIFEASRAASAILAEELLQQDDPISIKVYVEGAGKERVATVSVSGSLTR